ncbi:MAG: ATP-binding protein [Cyclobacteriaceae bacterium]|nr:ATP-binding protein [Cyclobacteriaceae bacterium]
MKNPFKYGELSTGENFCNRKQEIKRLQSAFRDGQSIVIISPRRWGKSSLVNRSVATFKGKLICIQIDCFGISSSREFYAAFLKATLQQTNSKLQQVVDTVSKSLKSLIPYVKYGVSENDEIQISLDLPNKKYDVEDILELPQRIAVDRKARLVVCIDEFQKIAEWPDGNALLEKLRSYWQNHNHVSYCLYGSKRHLMSALFAHSSQPFYRFGEILFLTKIEVAEWTLFLTKEFEQTGKVISPETSRRLVERVDSHSYFVQYLARICWNNSDKKVTQEILNASFNELLNDHLSLFQNQTRSLTKYQINYLKAVSAGETQLTSQRVLNQFDLGSPGNIKRNQVVFEDLEILDYAKGFPIFCDPYFKPLFDRIFKDPNLHEHF